MRKISGGLLVLFLVAFSLPVIILFCASFLQGELKDIIQGDISFSLIQYKMLFSNKEIIQRFQNSAVIATFTLIIQIPAALLGGFFLVRQQGKFLLLTKVCMLIALLLPFQSIMVPVFRASKWTGLFDHQISVVILQAFSALGPLTTWLFIRSIPDEQWEAAQLDTSSMLTIYVRIILPQLLPALCVLFLLCFAEVWNLVEQPLILLQDTELFPASLSLNDLTSNGVSYAGAIMYSSPIFLLYGFVLYLLKKSNV